MTPTTFCQLVETRLGWSPPRPELPSWRRYMSEAAKVKRKVAADPVRYTWHNLQLAVELLVREKTSRTPIGVFAYVDRALARSAIPDEQIDGQIAEAIQLETAVGDPHDWVGLLTRARGRFRLEVLTRWQELRR